MTGRPGTRGSRHASTPYEGMPTAAAVLGLVFGVGAFVVAAVFMGIDYFSVRGAPTERAVVVSVGPSGTEETCGPRAVFPDTPGERTTYRSLNPPERLPEEFSVNHCPDLGDSPGMVVRVRRTGVGEDDIYLDPIESSGQWLGMAGVVGAAAAVIAAVIGAIKETWRVHRTQRRLRRRPGGEDVGSCRGPRQPTPPLTWLP